MVIYKIKNLINSKIYIGQTTQKLNNRINSHFRCKENSLISKAIQKYGKENFIIEELEKCENIDKLNEREKYWIKFYNSIDRNFGYNLTEGGWNGSYSEDSKNKMREIQKGNINRRGKKASLETRKRISESSKNRFVSELTREKLKNLHIGKKKSKEHCENISKARKGFKMSDEQKRKLSEINLEKNKLKRELICVTRLGVI